MFSIFFNLTISERDIIFLLSNNGIWYLTYFIYWRNLQRKLNKNERRNRWKNEIHKYFVKKSKNLFNELANKNWKTKKRRCLKNRGQYKEKSENDSKKSEANYLLNTKKYEMLKIPILLSVTNQNDNFLI